MEDNCREIGLIISNSWGETSISLKEWRIKGPPRKITGVKSAFCFEDGRELPISSIPLKYRSDFSFIFFKRDRRILRS